MVEDQEEELAQGKVKVMAMVKATRSVDFMYFLINLYVMLASCNNVRVHVVSRVCVFTNIFIISSTKSRVYICI